MPKCQIILTAVPLDRSVNSPMTAMAHCQTHNMPMTMQTGDLCPIGKIEEATAQALAAIDAATADAIREVT
jgi:hypothetical protein